MQDTATNNDKQQSMFNHEQVLFKHHSSLSSLQRAAQENQIVSEAADFDAKDIVLVAFEIELVEKAEAK